MFVCLFVCFFIFLFVSFFFLCFFLFSFFLSFFFLFCILSFFLSFLSFVIKTDPRTASFPFSSSGARTTPVSTKFALFLRRGRRCRPWAQGPWTRTSGTDWRRPRSSLSPTTNRNLTGTSALYIQTCIFNFLCLLLVAQCT